MGSSSRLLAWRKAVAPKPVVPRLCTYSTGHWPLLRTSLVKIYSLWNIVTQEGKLREEMMRGRIGSDQKRVGVGEGKER